MTLDSTKILLFDSFNEKVLSQNIYRYIDKTGQEVEIPLHSEASSIRELISGEKLSMFAISKQSIQNKIALTIRRSSVHDGEYLFHSVDHQGNIIPTNEDYTDNCLPTKRIYLDYLIQFKSLNTLLVEALGFYDSHYVIKKNLDAKHLLKENFPVLYVTSVWNGLTRNSIEFQTYLENSKENWGVRGEDPYLNWWNNYNQVLKNSNFIEFIRALNIPVKIS